MKHETLKQSLKIESPTDNGFLDSRLVNFLDEMSSRVYFWFDKNFIEKNGYDINRDNGLVINTLSHTVFKLRKAVPAAKELHEAGLLNVPGVTKMGREFVRSFFDNGRVQPFKDEYGNELWALNLHLRQPSMEAVIDRIIGNCSKGHQQHEAPGLNGVHVCDYRIKPNCFYTSKMDANTTTGPFAICAQTPCLVGHIHSQVNGNGNLIAQAECNFNTI